MNTFLHSLSRSIRLFPCHVCRSVASQLRNRSPLLLPLALVVLTHALSRDTSALEPREVLAILKARDGQFDNVNLAYTMSGVRQQKDYSWRRLDKNKPAPRPTTEVEYLYHDRLIVRGGDITFHRVQQPDEISSKSPWKSMVWNNFEGVRSELVLYDPRFSNSPGTLEIHRNPMNAPDGETQHRMVVEQALGFGFGRRLISVDSVDQTAAGYTVRGPIKIWKNDNSRCELELDENFVVRKGVIDCEVKGTLTRIDVAATGTVERGGFQFAERGHYRRRHEGKLVDGKKVGTPRVEVEYDIAFEDAQFELPDKEYHELTRIRVPLGTTVVDPHHIGVANVQSVALASEERGPGADQFRRLLFINGAIVTLLLVALWLRGHRRAARNP